MKRFMAWFFLLANIRAISSLKRDLDIDALLLGGWQTNAFDLQMDQTGAGSNSLHHPLNTF